MSFLWHGLTDAGAQVPIQVDSQGRVIAVDGSPGVSNWVNTGTELYPLNNESVIIGGTLPSAPNISLNANGSAQFVGDGRTGTEVGYYFAAGGTLSVTKETGSAAAGLNIYQKGTSSPKISLNANGAATFAGSITAGTSSATTAYTWIGGNGNITTRLTDANKAQPALVVGYTDGSYVNTAQIKGDGSATFAGNVTAANITFRSSDPSYYAKDANDYSGPEVSLLDELVRLEALVNHLYQELGVPMPAQDPATPTNLMKLRLSSTQGKKKP